MGLAAALLAWRFVHLGGKMVERDTRVFDLAILSDMQALRDGCPATAAVTRDLSALGRTAALTWCTSITVGHLA